jgi:hypothetical protein
MVTFALAIEEKLNNFDLVGECTIFEAVPENPTAIVRTNEAWGVIFKWKQSGGLCLGLSGAWRLDCFLEKWGPGEGPNLPGASVTFENFNPHTYTRVLNFPAIGDANQGSYKISARLRLHGPAPPNAPLPVIAMGEGPMLDFYVAAFP